MRDFRIGFLNEWPIGVSRPGRVTGGVVMSSFFSGAVISAAAG